ncbi:MAG TPA: hypothetical protein VFM70_12710 [Salinimicrobium sp.]|nr:hypothetical protein [Salinimicrobium sp.]
MKIYRALLADFEELFLGYSALAVILSSCIGSVAAMTVLINGHDTGQMIQLFLVVASSMWYNTSVLAQMKPKFVFNSLLFNIILSVVLIGINVWKMMY